MTKPNRQITTPTGSRMAAMPAWRRAWSGGVSSRTTQRASEFERAGNLSRARDERTVQHAHVPGPQREEDVAYPVAPVVERSAVGVPELHEVLQRLDALPRFERTQQVAKETQ